MPATFPCEGAGPAMLISIAELICSETRFLKQSLDPEYRKVVAKIQNTSEAIIKTCLLNKEAESGQNTTQLAPWTDGLHKALRRMKFHMRLVVWQCYHRTAHPLWNLLREHTEILRTSGFTPNCNNKEHVSRLNESALNLQFQSQTLDILRVTISFAYQKQMSEDIVHNESVKQAEIALSLGQSLYAHDIFTRDIVTPDIITPDYLTRDIIAGDICSLHAVTRYIYMIMVKRKLRNADHHQLHRALNEAASFKFHWPIEQNRHFLVDRSTSCIFTGRGQELKAIEKAFATPFKGPVRRFVIQGLPGSGKSELAVNFAHRERHNYWGVFWVDGSSYRAVWDSLRRISDASGGSDHVGFPSRLELHRWLANACNGCMWLLIIDCADEERVVDECIVPWARNGCVLITTQNPSLLKFSTVGELRLNGMEKEEARTLLLRSADLNDSVSTKTLADADDICGYVGYLPVSLLMAGMAIRKNFCRLRSYIKFLEENLEYVRETSKSQQYAISPRILLHEFVDKASSMFSIYETLYESLEDAALGKSDEFCRLVEVETYQDALQLLQVFSYMHFENIRLDMLVYAAINPIREAQEIEKKEKEEENFYQSLGIANRRTWWDSLKDAFVLNSGLPPVLPEVLKNQRNLPIGHLEKEVRAQLLRALKELQARGLIMESTNCADCYSMDPMAHKWFRERPYQSTAQDALFCQMAKSILARAVRLIGTVTREEKTMRRGLESHINHVRLCEDVVRRRRAANQERRQSESAWLTPILFPEVTRSTFGNLQAVENMRFGKVYMESGEFLVAEELFRQVHFFSVLRLGEDHQTTHSAKLAIASSLEHQKRHSEAEVWKTEVYESRKKVLGMEHPLTLHIMRELGELLLILGRASESVRLVKVAREGMIKAYGPEHKETRLCASLMDRANLLHLKVEEALRHRSTAFLGAEMMDPDDSLPEIQYLSLKEELALASVQVKADPKDLAAAEGMLREVVERRTALLGEDHLYSLFAKGNHGRALAALGRFDEALDLMSASIKAAGQSLGARHPKVLAGKMWYGQALMSKGDMEMAETYLREAARDDHHKSTSSQDDRSDDRIMAVWVLVKCLQKQGKLKDAARELRKLETRIGELPSHEFLAKARLMSKAKAKAEELEQRVLQISDSSHHSKAIHSQEAFPEATPESEGNAQFFDDETGDPGRTKKYEGWKSRFRDVYEKFILSPPLHRVKIAVLDTGIDYEHSMFDAHDVKGIFNCYDKSSKEVPDKNGHGTFVAGLIFDYAPDADVYIVKITDTNSRPDAEAVADAINHAVDVWGVDIISMSFGWPSTNFPGYRSLQDAIDKAYSRRILMFAAASNNGGNSGRAYPASNPHVICVHSTDTNGNKSDFSPTEEEYTMNLATVGESVLSSCPDRATDHVPRSGTSYATPILVGIAAFFLEYAGLYLPGSLSTMKRKEKMEALLRRCARLRDGYLYVSLSLVQDKGNIFGGQNVDYEIQKVVV